MCLAIPAQITQLDGDGLATVDILGVTRSISLDLTPQAGVGDFVLVHAGFAIEVVDPDYAQETIDLIREFPDLAGDELPAEVKDVAATMAGSSAEKHPGYAIETHNNALGCVAFLVMSTTLRRRRALQRRPFAAHCRRS